MKRLIGLAAMLSFVCLLGGLAAREGAEEAVAGEHRRQLADHMETEADLLIHTAEVQHEAGNLSKAEAMEMKRRALELRHEATKLRDELREKHERPMGMPSGASGWGMGRRGSAFGGGGGFSGYAKARTPGASSVLILPAEAMDEGRREVLAEDVAVMAHVLRKALTHKTRGGGPYAYAGSPAPGGPFAPLFDGGRPESIYVQGFGALFILRVSFPLTGPEPRAPEEAAEPEEDSLWEQARREVTGGGPRYPGMGMEAPHGMPLGPVPEAPGGQGVEQFVVHGQVDRLTDVLVEALRHAANIRGLEPDASVAVAVLGPQRPRAMRLVRMPKGAAYAEEILREPGEWPATVLALRVKKAHLDAFAEGKMSEEEFREHVAIVLQ